MRGLGERMNSVKILVWGSCGLLAALAPAYLYAHVTGPDQRLTAAPGDDQLACATAGCHTGLAKGGPINAAGGGVTATLSSATYTPGVPITITVNVTDPNPANTHFGFQMTARLESDPTKDQAGDFTAGQNQIVICDDGSTKTSRGCPSFAPVQFIEHAFPSTNSSASTTPYTFTWMPPSTNVGPVHFYVAGNAVNNNHKEDVGDHVYTNSYVLTPYTPFTCTNTTKPVITFVDSAIGYGGYPYFAAGSWLEIKGTNLGDAADSRTQWLLADFDGVNAPTMLDGITVSINGKPAFVWYI